MKLFGRQKELKQTVKIQADLIENANQNLRESDKLINELKNELEKQGQEKARVMIQRNDAQFDLRKATDELSKAKAEIAELKDANSGLASSVAELKQRLRTMEARNKELMKRLASNNRNIERRKRNEQAEQVDKAQG